MSRVFDFGAFEFDVDAAELRCAGKPVRAGGLILRVLHAFVRRPGELITAAELVSHVWANREVSESALTAAIARLRKALGQPHGSGDASIQTVRGRGYRFLPSVAVRDASPPMAAVRAELPFVGRESIRARVGAAVVNALHGEGSMLVLSGEAGIGKTRLAELAVRKASDVKFQVGWVDCRAHGDLRPLGPFRGLLRNLMTSNALDADPRIRALLPELAVVLPELTLALDSNATPPSLDFDASSKARVFDAIARTLALAGVIKPQLLVFDALQYLDQTSLELVHYMLPALSRMHLLLVATVRRAVVSLDGAPRTSLLCHRNCHFIRLEPLDRAEVARWLETSLGHADAELSRVVHRISDGNPFVMCELGRQLLQHPALDPATLEVPQIALDLLRESVADLSGETLSVLTVAAAIGRKFGLAPLRAITGIGCAHVIAHLDDAVAKAIVKRSHRSATTFSFTSSLIRTALLERLSSAERRALHLRVFRVLDARLALAEAPISDLAEHAHTALPESDPRKAVRYAVEAADASRRAGAFTDAAHYVQMARAALDWVADASPRQRFELLLRQAALARGHSARRFLLLAEELLQLAREQEGAIPLAQAALLLDPVPGCPPPPELRAVLTEALARLPAAAPEWRPGLLARLATTPPLAYDAAASCRQLEHALQLAAESRESADHFCAKLGELYLYGGPAHEARAAEALAQLRRMSGDPARSGPLAPVLLDLHVAITALQRGNVPTALRALERGEACCRQVDSELWWHFARFRAVSCFGWRGATDARAALLGLHRRARRDHRSPAADLFCAFDQSVVLASRISPEARRVLRPDAEDPPNIWATKVRALAAAGLYEDAHRALALVPVHRLAHLPCDRDYLGTLGALARASIQLKAHAYSRALYALLSPYPDYFAVNLSFLCEGSVSDILRALAHSFENGASPPRHAAEGFRDQNVRSRGKFTVAGARASTKASKYDPRKILRAGNQESEL